MKPRVLFVARTRYALPLDETLAAPLRRPLGGDGLAPARHRRRRQRCRRRPLHARAAASRSDRSTGRCSTSRSRSGSPARSGRSGRTPSSSRARRTPPLALVGRRRRALRRPDRPRRPRRLARRHARVRLAAAAAAQPGRRPRCADYAVRHADGVRTVSGFTPSLVRDRGVEPAATFPAYMDLAPFLATDPVPLPDGAARALRRRPRALQGRRRPRRRRGGRVAPRLPAASLQIVGVGPLEGIVDGARRRARSCSVSWTPRLATAEVAAGARRGDAARAAVAWRGHGTGRRRGLLPWPRRRRDGRGRHPRPRRATTSTGCSCRRTTRRARRRARAGATRIAASRSGSGRRARSSQPRGRRRPRSSRPGCRELVDRVITGPADDVRLVFVTQRVDPERPRARRDRGQDRGARRALRRGRRLHRQRRRRDAARQLPRPYLCGAHEHGARAALRPRSSPSSPAARGRSPCSRTCARSTRCSPRRSRGRSASRPALVRAVAPDADARPSPRGSRRPWSASTRSTIPHRVVARRRHRPRHRHGAVHLQLGAAGGAAVRGCGTRPLLRTRKASRAVVRAIAIARDRGRGRPAALPRHRDRARATRDARRASPGSSSELGLGDAVILGGPIPRSEVPALLARSWALVNNTRSGAPDKVVFEACASCLPVLLSSPPLGRSSTASSLRYGSRPQTRRALRPRSPAW